MTPYLNVSVSPTVALYSMLDDGIAFQKPCGVTLLGTLGLSLPSSSFPLTTAAAATSSPPLPASPATAPATWSNPMTTSFSALARASGEESRSEYTAPSAKAGRTSAMFCSN